jgi:cell division transport system permease protein
MAWVATALAVGGVLTLAANTELFLVLGERSLSTQLRAASEFQVFLSDGAKQDQVKDMESQISGLPGVRKVSYRSKEEALRLARQDQSLASMAQQTSANPFPASLVVDLSDPSMASQVAAVAQKGAATDHNVPASYTPDQARRLSAFLSLAKAVVLGIALAGLGVASLVALVLLRSEIRARRAELRILTLVGTPRPVIRLPLLAEAIALAVAGSALATGVLLYVGGRVEPAVDSYLPFLQLGSATQSVELISLATLASSVLALGVSSLLVRLPR